MTTEHGHELINAARSYERIVAERRSIFLRSIDHKNNYRHDEWEKDRQAHWELKDRARRAEKLLAERIYGIFDFIRVDNVIYMAFSTETILRIPLDDIIDLNKETSCVGTDL